MLIPDLLRGQANRVPDRLAVKVVEQGSLTFEEWDQRSNAVAHGLIEAGVSRGGRVALLLTNANALQFHVGYFAIHKAGGVAVPINPRYAPREVEHVIREIDAEVVITAGDPLERVRSMRESTGVPYRIIAPDAAEDELDWDLLAQADPSPVQAPIDEDDLADILYTSATTGLPKGVAATHRNATLGFDDPAQANAFPDGGALLHSIPLTTYFGCYGAQHSALRLGLTNVLLPSFDAARFAALIASERPVMITMVPAMALLLLESGALADVDTTSVLALTIGGGALPPQRIADLTAHFANATFLQGYGLTESGSTACTIPPGEALKRPGSSGKPLPGVEIRIVDDLGNKLAADEVGEIVMKVLAPGRSYYADPDTTAQTWRDGWLYTGDLGYLDEDGYIYVVDRKKDMIKRGGYNIYSIEVENAIHEYPQVAEAAVVGVPHDILGEDVVASVRLLDGESLDLEDLRGFLAERLADYKVPRRVEIRRGPLPRTGIGKVDKKVLRAELGSS